jgi:PilZ domain-containing protein
MSFVERRGYERIEYPPEDRPIFLFDDNHFVVLDCSERGLRFSTDRPAPEVGTELRGTIRFAPGTEVEVEGAVLRVQADSVAVLFTTKWIPRDVIVSERWRVQRFAKQTPSGSQERGIGA